jgi:peptidoglycan hydrolase-like protein with peptidoglycan-binding domain
LTKKPEERRTLEEKRMLSDFKPLVDLLKNPTQIYNIISYQVNPKNIDENIDVSESIQVSEKTLQEGRNKLKAIQQRELGVTKPNQTTDFESPKTQTKITPTITTNEKTWINNISKGIWVLMKGSHTYNTKKGYEGVGDLIETIQEKLGIIPTGKFDQKTEDAVKNFQKQNDLTVDGIIGPKTISKLNLIET